MKHKKQNQSNESDTQQTNAAKKGRKKAGSVVKKKRSAKDVHFKLICTHRSYHQVDSLFDLNLERVLELAQRERERGTLDRETVDDSLVLWNSENIRIGKLKESDGFIEWALTHPKFTPESTLKRKDVLKPFSEDNCYWKQFHREYTTQEADFDPSKSIVRLWYSEKENKAQSLPAWFREKSEAFKGHATIGDVGEWLDENTLSIDEACFFDNAWERFGLKNNKLAELLGFTHV